MAVDHPSGTVTFLFTDIEGSTRRWDQSPELMGPAVRRHDVLLRRTIESNDGYVFKTVGDAFCAAFSSAPQALAAAIEAQRALFAEDWGEIGPIRVRMALHTGSAEERDGDYFGQPLNRVARLMAGHGGQTLLSLAAAELVRDLLPAGTSLRDMGEHRLKDLQRPEHVFQVVLPDLPNDFPPIKTLDSHPNNLPAQRTSLVGREKQIQAALDALEKQDVRLLTVTGPGGVGKTRLALQVAAEALDDFDSGVYFVPLAGVSDGELVLTEIAKTLDVRETSGKGIRAALVAHIGQRPLLLVLDNFEQVLAGARHIGDLLSACPNLKALATSRAALRVYGEHEFPLGPLPMPDPRRSISVLRISQFEAVRLFIERAQAVKPDFAIDNDNAPAIAEICYRLDGLPLALELAAARLRLFPAKALLARLEQRLPMLTGGARDLPARQQTLRGAIAWSFELLTESERRLFQRLSVLAGASLEIIELVCAPDDDSRFTLLEDLESLVGHSLVQQSAEDDDARFSMLETIREYALEKLTEAGEAEAFQRSQAEAVLELVRQAEPQTHGANQARALHQLEREHDNIRLALRWSLASQDTRLAHSIAGGIWWFWMAHGHLTEGSRWLEDVLRAFQAGPSLQHCQVLLGSGVIAWARGEHELAIKRLSESLDMARLLQDDAAIGHALNGLGILAHVRGDWPKAEEYFQESLELQRRKGDDRAIAQVLNNLGILASGRGDATQARALYEESLALHRRLRDIWGIARALANLGELARHERDFDAALRFYTESLDLKRELGDQWGAAQTLGDLALLARDRSDLDAAADLVRESLSLLREQKANWYVAEGLEVMACVATSRGKDRRAARIFGAAEALRHNSGTEPPRAEVEAIRPYLESLRQRLEPAEFLEAWSSGQAAPLEVVVNEALVAMGEP